MNNKCRMYTVSLAKADAQTCQLNDNEVQRPITYRLIGKSSVAGAHHVALAAIQVDQARGDQHPP